MIKCEFCKKYIWLWQKKVRRWSNEFAGLLDFNWAHANCAIYWLKDENKENLK